MRITRDDRIVGAREWQRETYSISLSDIECNLYLPIPKCIFPTIRVASSAYARLQTYQGSYVLCLHP